MCSVEDNSLSALERPVTLSVIFLENTLRSSLLPSVNTASYFFFFEMDCIMSLIPHLTYNMHFSLVLYLIGLLSGCIIKLVIAIYVPCIIAKIVSIQQ